VSGRPGGWRDRCLARCRIGLRARPVQASAFSVQQCLELTAGVDALWADPDPDSPGEANSEDRQVQGPLVLGRVRPVTGLDQDRLDRLVQGLPPGSQCSVHARDVTEPPRLDSALAPSSQPGRQRHGRRRPPGPRSRHAGSMSPPRAQLPQTRSRSSWRCSRPLQLPRGTGTLRG
jgi:hypothetical protein